VGKKSDRPNLPVLGGLWGTLESGETPTLDDAREKLGGPWIGRQDLGAPVDIPGPDGRRIGVVIHATPTERRNLSRRKLRIATSPVSGATSDCT